LLSALRLGSLCWLGCLLLLLLLLLLSCVKGDEPPLFPPPPNLGFRQGVAMKMGWRCPAACVAMMPVASAMVHVPGEGVVDAFPAPLARLFDVLAASDRCIRVEQLMPGTEAFGVPPPVPFGMPFRSIGWCGWVCRCVCV
jgi:hypothetical protein